MTFWDRRVLAGLRVEAEVETTGSRWREGATWVLDRIEALVELQEGVSSPATRLDYYAARGKIELILYGVDWRASILVDHGDRLSDGRPNVWTYLGVAATPAEALSDLADKLPWPPRLVVRQGP